MNTTFKRISFLFFLFISLNVHAQKDKKQLDTVGVFINMLGESTYMYDKVVLSGNGINYLNEKGKNIYQPHKYIKMMRVYDRIFLSVSPRFTDDGLKLMEVIAISPDYILMQYFNDIYSLFVYDKDFKMVLNNRFLSSKGSGGWKKNNENVLVDLKKYFNDCEELMSKMRKNLDSDERITYELSDIHCPEDPSYETIIQTLNKKLWYDEFIAEQEKKAKKKK